MISIELDGANNIRDFGNLPLDGGRKLRPGLAIRSSSLSELSEKDRKILSEVYSVRNIIDLRMENETARHPDRPVPGSENIHKPLLDPDFMDRLMVKAPDNRMLVEDMPAMYRSITTTEYSLSMLKDIFRIIGDPSTPPVLWHCTSGKDRCGTVSALFELALGADEDTVFRDYLSSNGNVMDSAIKGRDSILKKTGDAHEAEVIMGMMIVKPSYLAAALEPVKKHYASFRDFFEKKLEIDTKSLLEKYTVKSDNEVI
jgi:protein-tyrosine phosphatase